MVKCLRFVSLSVLLSLFTIAMVAIYGATFLGVYTNHISAFIVSRTIETNAIALLTGSTIVESALNGVVASATKARGNVMTLFAQYPRLVAEEGGGGGEGGPRSSFSSISSSMGGQQMYNMSLTALRLSEIVEFQSNTFHLLQRLLTGLPMAAGAVDLWARNRWRAAAVPLVKRADGTMVLSGGVGVRPSAQLVTEEHYVLELWVPCLRPLTNPNDMFLVRSCEYLSSGANMLKAYFIDSDELEAAFNNPAQYPGPRPALHEDLSPQQLEAYCRQFIPRIIRRNVNTLETVDVTFEYSRNVPLYHTNGNRLTARVINLAFPSAPTVRDEMRAFLESEMFDGFVDSDTGKPVDAAAGLDTINAHERWTKEFFTPNGGTTAFIGYTLPVFSPSYSVDAARVSATDAMIQAWVSVHVNAEEFADVLARSNAKPTPNSKLYIVNAYGGFVAQAGVSKTSSLVIPKVWPAHINTRDPPPIYKCLNFSGVNAASAEALHPGVSAYAADKVELRCYDDIDSLGGSDPLRVTWDTHVKPVLYESSRLNNWEDFTPISTSVSSNHNLVLGATTSDFVSVKRLLTIAGAPIRVNCTPLDVDYLFAEVPKVQVNGSWVAPRREVSLSTLFGSCPFDDIGRTLPFFLVSVVPNDDVLLAFVKDMIRTIIIVVCCVAACLLGIGIVLWRIFGRLNTVAGLMIKVATNQDNSYVEKLSRITEIRNVQATFISLVERLRETDMADEDARGVKALQEEYAEMLQREGIGIGCDGGGEGCDDDDDDGDAAGEGVGADGYAGEEGAHNAFGAAAVGDAGGGGEAGRLFPPPHRLGQPNTSSARRSRREALLIEAAERKAAELTMRNFKNACMLGVGVGVGGEALSTSVPATAGGAGPTHSRGGSSVAAPQPPARAVISPYLTTSVTCVRVGLVPYRLDASLAAQHALVKEAMRIINATGYAEGGAGGGGGGSSGSNGGAKGGGAANANGGGGIGGLNSPLADLSAAATSQRRGGGGIGIHVGMGGNSVSQSSTAHRRGGAAVGGGEGSSGSSREHMHGSGSHGLGGSASSSPATAIAAPPPPPVGISPEGYLYTMDHGGITVLFLPLDVLQQLFPRHYHSRRLSAAGGVGGGLAQGQAAAAVVGSGRGTYVSPSTAKALSSGGDPSSSGAASSSSLSPAAEAATRALLFALRLQQSSTRHSSPIAQNATSYFTIDTDPSAVLDVGALAKAMAEDAAAVAEGGGGGEEGGRRRGASSSRQSKSRRSLRPSPNSSTSAAAVYPLPSSPPDFSKIIVLSNCIETTRRLSSLQSQRLRSIMLFTDRSAALIPPFYLASSAPVDCVEMYCATYALEQHRSTAPNHDTGNGGGASSPPAASAGGMGQSYQPQHHAGNHSSQQQHHYHYSDYGGSSNHTGSDMGMGGGRGGVVGGGVDDIVGGVHTVAAVGGGGVSVCGYAEEDLYRLQGAVDLSLAVVAESHDGGRGHASPSPPPSTVPHHLLQQQQHMYSSSGGGGAGLYYYPNNHAVTGGGVPPFFDDYSSTNRGGPSGYGGAANSSVLQRGSSNHHHTHSSMYPQSAGGGGVGMVPSSYGSLRGASAPSTTAASLRAARGARGNTLPPIGQHHYTNTGITGMAGGGGGSHYGYAPSSSQQFGGRGDSNYRGGGGSNWGGAQSQSASEQADSHYYNPNHHHLHHARGGGGGGGLSQYSGGGYGYGGVGGVGAASNHSAPRHYDDGAAYHYGGEGQGEEGPFPVGPPPRSPRRAIDTLLRRRRGEGDEEGRRDCDAYIVSSSSDDDTMKDGQHHNNRAHSRRDDDESSHGHSQRVGGGGEHQHAAATNSHYQYHHHHHHHTYHHGDGGDGGYAAYDYDNEGGDQQPLHLHLSNGVEYREGLPFDGCVGGSGASAINAAAASGGGVGAGGGGGSGGADGNATITGPYGAGPLALMPMPSGGADGGADGIIMMIMTAAAAASCRDGGGEATRYSTMFVHSLRAEARDAHAKAEKEARRRRKLAAAAAASNGLPPPLADQPADATNTTTSTAAGAAAFDPTTHTRTGCSLYPMPCPALDALAGDHVSTAGGLAHRAGREVNVPQHCGGYTVVRMLVYEVGVLSRHVPEGMLHQFQQGFRMLLGGNYGTAATFLEQLSNNLAKLGKAVESGAVALLMPPPPPALLLGAGGGGGKNGAEWGGGAAGHYITVAANGDDGGDDETDDGSQTRSSSADEYDDDEDDDEEGRGGHKNSPRRRAGESRRAHHRQQRHHHNASAAAAAAAHHHHQQQHLVVQAVMDILRMINHISRWKRITAGSMMSRLPYVRRERNRWVTGKGQK